MPTLTVSGQPYAYSDCGSGPVILFGHGLSCDRHLFDAQIDALSDRYRCVSVDWPGHGESGYRPGGWSLDDLASDTIELIDALGSGPVTLVGLSQGGMIFMRVAARRPDLVDALVLLDTSARAEEPERAEMVLANAARIAVADDAERLEFYRDLALPAFYTRAWLDANPEAAEHELRLRMSHDCTGYALAVHAVATRPAVHELAASVTAPTLIIVGELDSLTPVDHARELHDLIDGSRLAVVPGSGHHTPVEQPFIVTNLLQSFLMS